ncbi:MAG: hypothetical protein ABJE10_00945 [bacterium]
MPLDTSFVTRVPQCPQKGIAASTGLAHFGQAFVAATGERRVGGIKPPEPTAAPGIGVSTSLPPATAGEGTGVGTGVRAE